MSIRFSKHWVVVALWVAVIFTAVPFVRKLREAFTAHWPAEFIGIVVMATVAAAALAALMVGRRLRRLQRADVVWLLAVAAILIVWTGRLMDQPEEAVHFLEYGVLGILLHRALRPGFEDSAVLVVAAVTGSIVGTFDELLQWVVPGRYFDFRDIGLNAGASVLVQVAIWRLAAPAMRPWSRVSRRAVCRVLAAQVAVLAVCCAATPQRLRGVSDFLPALGPLAMGDDVIAEYGFMHRLDERTRFRSRLSRQELDSQDRRRSVEVAGLLDRSRGSYGAFLREVSPVADPFAYEARVHLFSRGRRLADGRSAPAGSRPRQEHETAAFREHRILEWAFGRSLAASSFDWPPRRRARLEAAQAPDASYTSPVAAHLITWISEPVLVGLLLTVLTALLATDLALRAVSRSPPPPAS